MAAFYIIDANGDILTMSATLEVSKSLQGTLTSHPVQDGRMVTDHYRSDPPTITMSGVVTPFGTEGIDPKWYVQRIQALKDSKIPFAIVLGATSSQEGDTSPIDVIKNCLFTSLDISQDQKRGIRGGFPSYKISFSVKQINFSREITYGKITTQDTLVIPAEDIAKLRRKWEEEQFSSGGLFKYIAKWSGTYKYDEEAWRVYKDAYIASLQTGSVR